VEPHERQKQTPLLTALLVFAVAIAGAYVYHTQDDHLSQEQICAPEGRAANTTPSTLWAISTITKPNFKTKRGRLDGGVLSVF